ncbi:dienelactone hydrolase [Nitzschia inconspicua]|uniref:Dienelactone hydrolase n=1 Tax=Nitzschia inconspicua TaxID=303405 RepID=A0A9K3M6S7_9STRA|nr:dienelactone hydrolase [Nitzschia inconspicua]
MLFKKALLSFLFLMAGSAAGQVTPPTEPKTEAVEYSHEGDALLGHLSIPEGDGTFPAIIIIPDWDGVNEMEQIRATMVTEQWNMVGFAADIYGADKQTVEDIAERSELANTFRSNATLFAERIQAAIDLIKAHEKVNPDQVGLFGYCFGGTGILQYGMLGYDDVEAMVSFHGGLTSIPEPNATFVPKVLILSGGDDDTSTQIMDMEVTLDAAGAPWEITRYSGIEHAFTVWSDGRYNEWADMRSWESAGHFILEAFGIIEFTSAQPEEEISVTPVTYMGDDGQELTGHLAMPGAEWQRPLPAVVVFPDWDGVNEYEQERAYALAQKGYVAFAADIYGSDKQFIEDFGQRVEEVTKYRSDPDLYVSRMQNAIDQVKELTDDVDPDEIAIIGYCFGGSGVILYSLSNTTDAKVSVPFHGSFEQMPPVRGDISSYLLVLSGGDDDAHGNQTVMEMSFEEGDAEWEITRYAGILHGYTSWYSDAYDLVADARSWESMLTSFQELMAVPVSGDATSDPCVEISREGVACPGSEPLAPAGGSDGSAGSALTLGFSVVAAAAAIAFAF